MYLPKHHEETDISVLHRLIESHPLGAWVTLGEGGLVADHIPFLLDRTRGSQGTLMAHVARANPAWHTFTNSVESIVLFQGVESYITPSWYPGKHEHGKAVPTWNYAVVHAYGAPRVIEEPEWLLHHLNRLTDTHEARQAVPWKVSDAPAEFIERLLGAIVGIEIPITRLVGKWKVSQNRPEPDKLGVIAGLHARGGDAAKAMAAMVAEHASLVAAKDP